MRINRYDTRVLILVVVEYEFVVVVNECSQGYGIGLNPCCSGIWIRRVFNENQVKYLKAVLILVVVEYEFVEEV